MAFGNFTFPQVQRDLGLTYREADLFSHIAACEPRAEFAETLKEGATLALALDTEKARSEFMIAPILFELRRMLGRSFGLFSGIELNVDASKGLNGVCDFILSQEAIQYFLTAPLITVVEAKNDNVHNGLAQCIASTYAAAIFNQRAGREVKAVFGVITTGTAWKFLRIEGADLTLDPGEYYIDNVGKIMGVLKHIIETA